MLEEEIKTFEANLDEWRRSREGQCVLIKGAEVIGFYLTSEEALAVGAQKFGLQSFLVREVGAREEPLWIPTLALGLIDASSQHSVSGQDKEA